MTTFWPSTFSISAAVTRVTWSVEPPAAQGTMMVIGLVGFHCCAEAAGATVSARSAAIPVTNNVRLLRSMASSLKVDRLGDLHDGNRLADSVQPEWA